jgi:glycosyltransferase involved in cell wall biosynthesis
MPTYNRRSFIPNAIRYFLRQEYPNKELIVIDDGTDSIEDLIPAVENIRYYRLENKKTLGAKLNMACEYAAGNIIAHWDDDDWYAPRRLQYQFEELSKGNKELCGINNLLYFDLRTHKALQYIYPSNHRVWLIGSSLFYQKDLWSTRRFADIDVGMDGLFVWSVPPERIEVLTDSSYAVHMIHDHNISPKKTDGLWWHTIPVDQIQEILDADWPYYMNDGFPAEQIMPEFLYPSFVTNKQRSGNVAKNIYACLVHEQWECVVDLILNLHYHDPESTILLYNGSQHETFLDKKFPFEKFGVVIHPTPKTMKYGYLHQFAFDCMEYARANFSYDILTIVDSDQLQIKRGYSYFLSEHLSYFDRLGMFSSAPQRVTSDDKINLVARQAFKEYELWKPLLAQFPDGESKFVHWTFWPGSVFTRDAITDMLDLLAENTVLHNILEKTKIWATEEIILPTLVRLLGYEVAGNPVGYDFIKYKKQMSIADIVAARKKYNSFWVHPVARKLEDPVRKYIRATSYQQAGEMQKQTDMKSLTPAKEADWLRSSKKIAGWLNDSEAEVLMQSAKDVVVHLDGPHDFVEIGSYHGKSTVLLGGIAKICMADVKIYAIDPHDGKLGDPNMGIQQYPPSLESFKKNLRDAGLLDDIEIIQNYSDQVIWHKPISFLFIDGLHDYEHVAADFNKFDPWIRQGGYLLLHDYADYYPGVKRLVDELSKNNSYRRIKITDTLVVFQKS